MHVASQSGDLLVIGTRRHGTVSRVAGGNVSRYCLARAGCRVLAVPPAWLVRQVRHGPGQATIAITMTLTMCVDHRVVDGVTAVRFLTGIGKVIEEPLGIVL